MSEKRRKDETHDVGDSTPGTVGDSDGTYHDDPESPMANVQNRRRGELLTESETAEFLDDSEDDRWPDQKSREERLSDEEYERQEREKLVHRSAKNYGHYWSEEKQLEYLEEYGKTPEEMDWEIEIPTDNN